MSVRRVSVLLLALALLGSCARGGLFGSTSDCEPDDEARLVAVDFGDACVVAEVASTGPERQLGLMNRTELGEDSGMLFIYSDLRTTGFWMKNTLLPLSIAYMVRRGEGSYVVVSILDMQPCEADPCPGYDPGAPYDTALEVNQGWFEEAGVSVGSEALLTGTLPTPA